MQTTQTQVHSAATSSFTRSDWQGGYRSQPEEFDYWIDQVEGQIPHELEGTLFRNGPGLLDVNGQRLHHPFDGDGMVSAIAFSQGRAYYRNRFVRTTGFVAEQQANKVLYRGTFGTQKPGGWLANAFDLRLKNIANTNVIYWGDKLLALWEAAEPYRLDPRTLETMGPELLDGLLAVGSPFSAHPRIDPHGGRTEEQPCLVNFSVKPGLSSTITIYEFDPTGQLVKEHAHSIPGFAFLHDFAITPNYCIFFQNPVTFNPLPYVVGFKGAAECLQFRPNQPTLVIVIPRDGQAAVQMIETEPCFVFHHANAFEQGDSLYIDSICYDTFPSLDTHKDYQQIDFDEVPVGQLWRFQLDLKAKTAQRQCLIKRGCEFPSLNPEQVGRNCRYLYLGTTHAPEGNAPLQALLKVDLTTGAQQYWSAAPRGFMSEPLFIPRPGAVSEDEGWLLAVIYNATRECSDVVVLDARDVESGPIARLYLKHHIPYGLHGSFTPQYFGPTG
ncbi:MAG: Apocarotenoid-15,15'-oxygenase [Cyanothece sp. SIO1E1]|nr:Apocarotenoid-15,15'-oxygenase [Cyanothece sp. SIO1E1]